MVEKTKVAVIGTGRMGTALARALLAAGHPTAVWNRTVSKTVPLVELGARLASSVEDAVNADVVIVNVDRYESSDRLLRGAAAQLRGKLLVQTTSGTPEAGREGERWASEHGIEYLDAAILTTPDRIGAADTMILYAGRTAPFERYRDLFATLGGAPTYVGTDAGHASSLDAAVLSLMWGTMAATLVGAKICASERVPLETYRAFVGPLAPVLGVWSVDLLQRVEARRFGSDTTPSDIRTHHDAFRHLVELSRHHGIAPSIHDGLDRLFRAAIDAGRGDEDFSALYDFLGR